MTNQSDMPSDTEIDYFKKILDSHDRVNNYQELSDQQYTVNRTESKQAVFVYLTGLYTIGIADCMDILQKNPQVNCIVSSAAWNGYTSDAKEYTKSNEVGLFTLTEFMGAMNYDEFWNYVKKNRD